MAAAQANLERANEMLALRDEFAGDAITFDAALQEMRSSFEQKSGTFARSVDDAVNQERFSELHKLLLGYRDLKGAAEQQEYSSALSRLKEVGDGKYTAAMQIISTINDDARGRSCDFPPSVEQVATSLRWIEGARCLSVGEDSILPVEVSGKWQSAFLNMTKKLELLKAREAKLEEWKFATVEEIHRRLGQLLMLRFPEEISDTITRMQSELSAALDAKVAGLDNDVRNALEKGDHLLLDFIFQEVQIAKDADSYFVNNVRYISLVQVMEHFLYDLVESIKGHFMKLEIKEAHSKQQQLWSLEKANVVRPHVARTGLDTLAEQKKRSMITRSWLSEGHVKIVKAKVKGFRDVDPVNYQMLVGKFMDSFEDDIKRLRKVDTKTDVIEVRQVVLQIPRFVVILDDEQSAFKKGWNDIWNSFFESVDKKLRLACACAGQEHDISDSISFLQAARLLLQNFMSPTPFAPTGLSTATLPIAGGARLDVANAEDEFVDAVEDQFVHAGSNEFIQDFEEPKCAFPLPFDDLHVKTLIEKLDSLLGHIEVDTVQIDAGWTQHVEKFDCKAEARSFVETLNFIRQLKRQAQAVRTCGEYGWGKPTPTPDRAVTKLFVSVAELVKALDASRPEECAVVLQNLDRFDKECNRVVDDDFELQQQISNNIKKYSQEAWEWVGKVTKDFMEKSTEKYRQAQLEHSPEKRKRLLHEVIKVMDQHQLLEEKLVERGLKQNNGTDSPLVAQIKSEISGKTERTLQRLRARNCTVEDVAGSIHEIYVAAMDLGNTAIFKHSENCIALIFQDCRGKSGMGLTELGVVLERDLPQGSEIVANMPQFAELNRLAFQKMTSGKSAEGTVADVAKLNNLSESHARTLLELVKQVFAEYDNILKSNSYHYDLPTIVTKIKNNYDIYRKVPALIGGVFAVWSLESKTELCPTPRRPLPAQVVAIVRLLALDDLNALGRIRKILPAIGSLLEWWYKSNESRINASHLAQIKTGQGKSVVLGTLATVLCIAGFSVDCVCYSAYLSERDQLDFKATFDLFGVRHMVQYGTFQQLSERLVNSEGDVRELTRDLMLSSERSMTMNPSGAKGGQKKRILLVDEVDVFFSRSFYGETYDAVEHLKIPEITELQKKAWSMRGDTKRILPALKSMDAYKTLMNKFPDVKGIWEGQINIMIRDLEAWKNEDSTALFRAYKIMDGKVAYKSGVCYDTKINYNYVTLWTYFHEVECKRVPEAALEDYLGLMIKCGQFSYAEIPKRYNLILGVTGTLVPETKDGPEPLGTFEREIIRDDYKITGRSELPSVFGERNLTFRENDHVSVQKDEDSYNNAISLEVAKAVDGRAVLVFFESESKLEAWQDSTYGQRVPVGTMECIKSDTRDITLKVRKATHAGQVTLLSREHGRGLDFHCTDKKVDELGGLHVVQTFLSEELSEEIQIRGRTARQKNKGSFQMILLAKDLEKFEISNDEIEQKEKGVHVPVNTDASAAAAPAASVPQQTMYEFLHAKRAVFLDKSSVTRREAVSCAKALHDQSAAFQRDLLAFSQAPKQTAKKDKDKCLQFLRSRNIVQAKCRLLCLSDATGSMSDVWGKTQNSIRTMLERISEISGGSSNIEVKWLAFRDYELERSKVIEASPWTDNPASLVKFVGSIRCHSGTGCDGPEAVEAALYHANNDPTQQPTRVLLIGDAPPHHERKGQKLERLTVHASNLGDGGFVAGGVLSTDYRQECNKLKEKEVKVFSFYLHDGAKASFDEIASMTGGESKKLNCSDAESLVHAVCETALEDIGGSAMQERYRAQYRAT
jgi:hypothetical protein